MLATDIDGTLLRSDGSVSPRTRTALDAAREAGLAVVFVSGRPPRWLDEVGAETGHLGTAVGANGAVLYDLSTASTLWAHHLDTELMSELTTELRATFAQIHFAVEYGEEFGAEPGYVHDWAINPRLDRHGNPVPPPTVGPLEKIIAQPGVKLLGKDRDADPDTLLAAATELLGERATVTSSSSFGLLEIGPAGVTKASGLAEYANDLGIAAGEVAAIGDMPNDVPMLRWAGQSYAVANAHPAAKAAADDVVGSNDEDAVAELIHSILSRA
jgi:Cof subfamily protein (haloacid dehalogenase superfamily)